MRLPQSPDKEPAPFGRYAPRAIMSRILGATRGADASWLGRRRAFFWRSLAMRSLNGRPLDVEALGARMRLFPDKNVCEKRILFTPQYFDEEERLFLKRRLHDAFVFIDIGANIGGYSLYVGAQAGPRCKILAIEPQPAVFERLTYNIRQNPFATIKALNCAVADQDGEITLFLDRTNQGGASMRLVHSGDNGPTLRAPALTLANIVEKEGFDHVDAVKIDAEGAEDLILEPFFRTAPETSWPKLLLLEHAPNRWAIDLEALLIERGYALVLHTRRNIAYERKA